MRINAEIIRKYSLEEVALLVMFAFGLLIAGLIVVRRSRIEMSEPVQLPYSGLSLSLPAGPGWEWEGFAGWSYATTNEFNLSKRLLVGNKIAAGVHCRYLLASPETDPEQVLTDRLSAATLQEVRSGRIVNDVAIHWVQIADTFLGVASLDHGRMLEVMVKAPAEHRLADKVFRLVAESVVFESDKLISQGVDFIQRFRSQGLADIRQQQNAADSESVYLINDAGDKPAGFQIEIFRRSAEGGDWSSVAVERIHYTVGTRGQTSKSHFECTDRLDRFIWRSDRTIRRARRAITTEIELTGDGYMKIRRATSSKELTYRPADGAVPEILIDRIARAFLDAYENGAVIDLILADGAIVPAVISTVGASLDTENKWGAAYSVRVRFLLGGDAYVQSYFDFEKNLVGKIDKSRRVLYWHKSDRKTLAETFDNIERHLGPPPVGR
ncbi:MAG: hypothetical protein DRP66_07810 [Planctomycetota bacterium]|nr:MAG: hypothetical protein DRP66_07810 [Planctomycetota bacterium]